MVADMVAFVASQFTTSTWDVGAQELCSVVLIKGQFFKYRKEKRKEKSLRGRGGGLRRSGGAPGADLACKRHRHVQSWLLESPNFL